MTGSLSCKDWRISAPSLVMTTFPACSMSTAEPLGPKLDDKTDVRTLHDSAWRFREHDEYGDVLWRGVTCKLDECEQTKQKKISPIFLTVLQSSI